MCVCGSLWSYIQVIVSVYNYSWLCVYLWLTVSVLCLNVCVYLHVCVNVSMCACMCGRIDALTPACMYLCPSVCVRALCPREHLCTNTLIHDRERERPRYTMCTPVCLYAHWHWYHFAHLPSVQKIYLYIIFVEAHILLWWRWFQKEVYPNFDGLSWCPRWPLLGGLGVPQFVSICGEVILSWALMALSIWGKQFCIAFVAQPSRSCTCVFVCI